MQPDAQRRAVRSNLRASFSGKTKKIVSNPFITRTPTQNCFFFEGQMTKILTFFKDFEDFIIISKIFEFLLKDLLEF